MDNLEQTIREIVKQVVEEINKTSGVEFSSSSDNGVFNDINSAIEAAEIAQKQWIKLSLEDRETIIQKIREVVLKNNEIISKMAVEETGYGRVEHKIIKNKLAAIKTPGTEDLVPLAYSDDNGLTLVERAPFGVIGAITPSTNPTSSIINNAISMIAAGNSVFFNTHPAAKNVSIYTISLLNKTIIESGGPGNLITTIASPTIESAQAMMSHPKVRLLVVTGGPGVVAEAMKHPKRVIAAGPGNPPVVVDETADIEKAAKDIVNGAGFDNNVVCILEKEIIAISSIADRLKEYMRLNGAYELTKEQADKLIPIILSKPGSPGVEGAPNKKFIGKNPSFIAKSIGLDIPESTKILLMEVPKDHPLVWTEQLMPVIPLVRVNNVDEAIDFAVDVEFGFKHTAIMHSKNIENLSKMAKRVNCSLFVKNGPSYSGLGYEGPGFTTLTIASPTGEGMTRARTFTRERRCTLKGYFRIV